LQNYEYKEIKR